MDGPPRRGPSLSDHSLQTPSAPRGRRRDVSRDAAAQTPVAQRGEEESERRKHEPSRASMRGFSVVRICRRPAGEKRRTSLTSQTFCPGKRLALCAGELSFCSHTFRESSAINQRQGF